MCICNLPIVNKIDSDLLKYSATGYTLRCEVVIHTFLHELAAFRETSTREAASSQETCQQLCCGIVLFVYIATGQEYLCLVMNIMVIEQKDVVIVSL